ncbi:MAG: V-type ATP synthase subunit I [Ruminococcaceae bacterium]|nr:V-type ATP synthase subunit I [Oscillospiraceae bacterium]
MIAPMKKVSVVCMKEDRDKLLTSLQHSELIMITSSEEGLLGSDTLSSRRQTKIAELLKELDKYSKKKGLFNSTDVELKDFEKISDKDVELCEELEEKFSKKENLSSSLTKLKEKNLKFSGWESLTSDLSLLSNTKYSVILTGVFPVNKYEVFKETSFETELSFVKVSADEKVVRVILTFLKEDEQSVRNILATYSFEEVVLPVKTGTIKEEKEKTEKEIIKTEELLNKVNSEIEDIAKSSRVDLETLFEKFRARAERSEVRLLETVETVLVEGFVKEADTENLKKVIGEAVDVFDAEFYDPEEDEEVPTALNNGKFTSQFESITEMFNAPSYKGFDPNAVMAPWYWIIFGMMMGDAGYGLMMAVLIFLAKKIMKPKGSTEKLMNVLFYSSFTTIIFGVLFGSYFGEELIPSVLPFTAMEDPVKMLLVTIVVGVLHIFTGMIVKIVLNVKAGHIADAIFDQVSWMMIIAGIGLIFIAPLQKVGMVIAIVGALIVLFTAGRSKKGVVGKAVGGLVGLYGITSYFSDILSYSRILALGLATGVVGMVMNMLAGMIQGNIIGFILSLVIYVVGHVFNLVLGLLSAYVHDCRLQYIEFYGKFYEGGGKPFRPFKIRTNYINIKKD